MDNTVFTLIVLGIVVVGALAAIFMGIPALVHLGTVVEALAVLGQGIDEYFNRPGLSRVCCITTFLIISGCCLFLIAALLLGLRCFTDAAPGICRLIGR